MQFLRGALFTPRLAFDDLDALNAWLHLRCEELANRLHPDKQDRICPAGNTVVLALATHASLKLDTVC